MNICPECGKSFTPPSWRPNQECCSAKCRNTHTSKKTADKRSESLRGRGNNKTKYRKLHGQHEHRLVMEQKLGRKLFHGEIVHHIDGNSLNNNPENLIVLTQSEHATSHSTKNRLCSVEGCFKKHHSRGLCNMHRQRKEYRKEVMSKCLETLLETNSVL